MRTRIWHGSVISSGVLISTVLCSANALAQHYERIPTFPSSVPTTTTETTRTSAHTERRVTVVARDSTVDYIVQAIGRQADLRLVYDGANPAFGKRIDVRLENVAVMKAFAVALKGTGLVASLTPDGETVTIHGDSTEKSRRAGAISGHVVDSATGRGLSGATVAVQGIKLSAMTGDSGRFTLRNVPVGDRVVVVRLFGYRPATRPVTVSEGDVTSIRLELAPAPNVLSGVVTTATGQQRRIEVGNDITVLNADSILRIAPVSNLTEMLATRVPGLIVQNTSGIPGAPSRIRIRGASSVTTSDDPILIVDGVRMNADQSGNTDNSGNLVSGGGSRVAAVSTNARVNFAGPALLDQVDPNSIEKIEVLKGPSATAVYGSDAANGVIVVTTKRGRPGPTTWNLSLDGGRSTLPGDWPTFYHTFYRPVNGGPTTEMTLSDDPGSVLVATIPYQALNDPRISPLGAGYNGGAALTVRGGNGSLTYSVTGSANDDIGYLHLPDFVKDAFEEAHHFPAPGWMTSPATYKTSGGNSSIVAQLGRGAAISLNSSLFRTLQQQSTLEGSVLPLMFRYIDTSTFSAPGQANSLASTIFPNYATLARFNTTTFTNALSLTNWTPLSWIPPITAIGGLSIANTSANTLTPRDYILDGSVDSLGAYSLARGTDETQSLRVSALLLPDRIVRTAVGLDIVSDMQETYQGFTIGLPIGVSIPSTLIYTNGEGPSESSVRTSTYGWYLQPTLHLSDRFFMSPGFRLDGGSATGNGGLGTFPKIDMSYVAINRQSDDARFGLTLLRPRLAFGVAGVQPTPGQQLRLFQSNVLLLPVDSTNSTRLNVLPLLSLGNTQLHPERSRELEGGIDAEFGNQRVSVSLTGYNKMRYDAIMSIPLAPSVSGPSVTGPIVGTTAVNVGDIRNSGVEASVSARLIDLRALTWSVNGNISQNRQRVTRLNSALPNIQTGGGDSFGYTNRVVVGYPLNGIWARPVRAYSDADSNGFVTSNEIRLGDSTVYLGSPQPNYEMALSTSLGFLNGHVQVNTSFDYQNGLTQIFEAGVEYNGGCSICDVTLLMNDPKAPLAEQAALFAVRHASPPTSFGLAQTVNVLRWNTLSVTYLFPQNILRQLHVPFLSVALQGSNLYLRSNYRGKDPNVNANISGNLTQDDGELPQPRTWGFRMSIGY